MGDSSARASFSDARAMSALKSEDSGAATFCAANAGGVAEALVVEGEDGPVVIGRIVGAVAYPPRAVEVDDAEREHRVRGAGRGRGG